MGSFSIWHWLIVLLVILLLFGGGSKLSNLMGDLAKGIKNFKAGMQDEDTTATTPTTVSPAAASTAPDAATRSTTIGRDEPAKT